MFSFIAPRRPATFVSLFQLAGTVVLAGFELGIPAGDGTALSGPLVWSSLDALVLFAITGVDRAILRSL
jgi:hypothetical protein